MRAFWKLESDVEKVCEAFDELVKKLSYNREKGRRID